MKFRLSTEDTARLGLPETLEFDWTRMTVAEARQLRQTTDIEAAALQGAWARGELDAVLAIVWLAARRAGVELDWSALEFNLYGIQFVKEPADELGKGSSKKPETSPATPKRTRRSSATSAP